MTAIKLCGLMTPQDIASANLLKPDYVGFVFAQGSRRALSLSQARELKRLLHPAILAVGVFVDEDPDVLASFVDMGCIDVVQLHGSEDAAYIADIKRRLAVPVIQAFRIADAQDIRRAEESHADMILLDSGAGTGQRFDWTLPLQCRRPYFLAGGLGIDSVEEAMSSLHPAGLDVSSGIETGYAKDPNKMAAFVAQVRKMDAL